MPETVSIETADEVALCSSPGVVLGAAIWPIETAEDVALTRHVDAWLRDYNTPTEQGRVEQVADLPTTGLRPNDWYEVARSETTERGLAHKQARWDGAAWQQSKVYVRGPAATEVSGFRWQWAEPPYIAELTDGTTRKFYLKDDGAAFFAGSVDVNGNITLVPPGRFRTAPPGNNRLEIGPFDAFYGGGVLFFYNAADQKKATLQFAAGAEGEAEFFFAPERMRTKITRDGIKIYETSSSGDYPDIALDRGSLVMGDASFTALGDPDASASGARARIVMWPTSELDVVGDKVVAPRWRDSAGVNHDFADEFFALAVA